MKPADLLSDLETGDRTDEHLFPKTPGINEATYEYWAQNGLVGSSVTPDSPQWEQLMVMESERRHREMEHRMARETAMMTLGGPIAPANITFDEGNLIQRRRGWTPT